MLFQSSMTLSRNCLTDVKVIKDVFNQFPMRKCHFTTLVHRSPKKANAADIMKSWNYCKQNSCSVKLQPQVQQSIWSNGTNLSMWLYHVNRATHPTLNKVSPILKTFQVFLKTACKVS